MAHVLRAIASAVRHSLLTPGSFQKTAESQSLWQQYTQVRTKFIGWRMKKDHSRRQMVKEFGPERLRINAIRKNTILPKEIQDIATAEVKRLPRDSNASRVTNRCILSGRSRGNLRRFKMNRMMWRMLADYNHLSGVKRSQW